VKIALISDIHANLPALDAVLAAIDDVYLIICAGDITGYHPYVNQVIERMDELGIQFIIGNHDAYLLESDPSRIPEPKRASARYTASVIKPEGLAGLSQAGPELELYLGGRQLRVYHGSPANPLDEYVYSDSPALERLGEIDADVVVLGHTHIPMVKQVGGVLVVNPGSVGQPRDGDPRASFAVLDLNGPGATIHRVEYPVEEVCSAVVAAGLDPVLCRVLREGKVAGSNEPGQ